MNKFFVATALLALAGCAAPPAPTVLPTPDLPAAWNAQAVLPEAAGTEDFWNGFGSAELVRIVATARVYNFDIGAAAARVEQARALLTVARAGRLPRLDAAIDASEQRSPRDSGDDSDYGLTLRASYEADLWGRRTETERGAEARLAAQRHDSDAVRLTVSAHAADAWLLAVGLTGRLALAQNNLASAQRMLNIVEARHRAGAALPLDLAQQRGLVAAQQRVREEIAGQLDNSRLALALLLGQAGSVAPTASLDALRIPVTDVGVPSQLLVRRPDIARAEAQLQAADADIAVARANMLPSLSLQAGVGTGGLRLARLLDTPVYSLAAALAAPIFDNGELAARRSLELARREELLAEYRRAIAAAFADTGQALHASAALARQHDAQQEELAQAARALALAESRYRAGAENALTLLDAQRTHFAAQDAALALRTAQLQAAVALYRAAGGGWTDTERSNAG